MDISYSRPLELGWRRMKLALFHPFDLGRWFVLGFTAWLAQLGESTGGSGGSSFRVEEQLDQNGLREVGTGAWHWFTGVVDSPAGIFLIAMATTVVLLLTLLLIWVSSRGRFMFLDNLIHSRTEVSAPWREFQAQGDSLFLWRIGYSLVALLTGVVVGGGFIMVLVPELGLPDGARLLGAISLGVVAFIYFAIVVFIDYCLDNFVVPLMYLRRSSTTAAWGVFLGLFQTRPGAFFLFGLLYLGITIVMGMAYLIGGLLTCCLGLILLAIPYLGTVLALPLPVLGRFMNLEFLAQFGPDYNLLPPLPTPDSGQFDADRTVVRPVDIGQDTGPDETGPQNA